MSWKNLTWFAIAVLIIINSIFAITVFIDYRNNNYYDASSISEITEILSSSGITLDSENFPTRRVSLPVYNLPNSFYALGRAADALTGEKTETSGSAYTVEGDSGIFTLNGDFTFEYVDISYDGIGDEAGEKVTDKAELKQLSSTALSFVDAMTAAANEESRQSAADLSYGVDDVYRIDDGVYTATIYEYIDTYKTVNTINVVVAAGKVVFADGSIMFALPTNKYSANNYELFGILIKEKRYFDSAENAVPMTISSIEYIYDMCFDVFDNIYLIPACAITYTDGTVHIYDIVSSDLISE